MKSRIFIWGWLALAVCPSSAFAEDPKPVDPLKPVENVPSSQVKATQAAEEHNRAASALAQKLGRGSITRGLGHIRHGRQSFNRQEIHLGVFQLVQGILGLLASAESEKLANKAGGNAGGLAQVPGGQDSGAIGSASSAEGAGGAQVTGASSDTASSSLSVAGLNSARELLNDPEFADDAKELEEEFGMTRAKIAVELAKGRDPVDLFTNAPRGGMTREEALAARRESGEGLAEQRALASAAPVAPVLAAAAQEDESVARSAAGMRDRLRNALLKNRGSEEELEDLNLSPEVRKALETRRAEEAVQLARQLAQSADPTIFSMVHSRYHERENRIRWGESFGKITGVADAN